MQIVIELTDEEYETVETKGANQIPDNILEDIMFAIEDGVQLPREHGRLIDADKLIDEYNKIGFYSDIKIQILEESQTILEATR